MAIPKINLIPPAYYLRKKVKAVIAAAVSLIVLEVIGLVAFAIMQSQQREALTQQQTDAQARADAVAKLKSDADTARSSVKDVADKVGFVGQVFKGNEEWPAAFENIARYTYPKVQYTSMKPTAGSDIMVLHVKTPSQRALNTYWSNLLRSPMVKTAAPSAFLGYTSPDANGANGAGPNTGGPIPGGPIPGGPPAPGGPSPTGPSPITNVSLTGTPGAAFDPSQIQLPPPPPTYDFDMTVQLADPIKPATFGGAPATP